MAESFGATPAVYRNGQRLPEETEHHLHRVVIESDLLAPDSCRLLFDDPERSLLEKIGFDFLDTIKVTSGRTGEDREDVLFEGLVYSLEFEYADKGALSVVGAFDRSYALYNGVHTRTYRDQTDADIARQIANDVSLKPGGIGDTKVVHRYIAQVNETYFDFLTRRARELDFELRVLGNTLHFNRPAQASDAPEPGDYETTGRLQLTPGANLEAFTSRVTAAQQASDIEVRGWDVHNKQVLVATVPAASRSAALKDTPRGVARKHGSPKSVLVDVPLGTQAECEAAAASESERVASTFAHAEGVARGDPRLLAGTAVSVGQTGGRFDGKYTITSARHVFGHAGYKTHFAVTGRHDRSILGMVNSANGSVPLGAGVVIAVVTNVSDADGLGRVKLKLPWLADDYESDWARVVQLGAGKDRGLVLLPEVNDEVLVAFEHGDTRRPFVIGGLYNGVDKPAFGDAVDGSSGTVAKRAFKTRKGHTLVFDDTDGKESIELATPDHKVTVRLDHAKGTLTIETDKDVTVHAKADATVKADRNITVQAGQSVGIKAGTSMTLEAGADVTVKGAVIKLN